VIERHGREGLGVSVGNPGAHSLSAMTFSRALLTGLGTRPRTAEQADDWVSIRPDRCRGHDRADDGS